MTEGERVARRAAGADDLRDTLRSNLKGVRGRSARESDG